MKPVSLIVSIFLLLVAILHLIRLVFHVEVIVAGTVMPLWISVFGSFVPVVLAGMLRRENRSNR